MIVDLQHKIQVFFDNNIPCPPYINNCEALREEFKREYDASKQRQGCSSCMERSLRNRFIERLQSEG